ncbi:MAG TPA: sigma factor [Candidatus Dormibacteraeota bacterium]
MGAQPAEPSGDDDVMRDLRRQARLAPRIGPADQDELLDRSAAGDPVSQERLVAANLEMVIRLAEAREDQGLSLPDLVQEGSLGLVEAVRGFTPSGRPDFVAFAEQKIGEKMDAALGAEAAAVRDAELLVNAANDYERTELLVARELRRAPTSSEIAEKLEWTVERTEYVARVVAEARRRHDEELLAFIDPDALEIDDTVDGE